MPVRIRRPRSLIMCYRKIGVFGRQRRVANRPLLYRGKRIRVCDGNRSGCACAVKANTERDRGVVRSRLDDVSIERTASEDERGQGEISLGKKRGGRDVARQGRVPSKSPDSAVSGYPVEA